MKAVAQTLLMGALLVSKLIAQVPNTSQPPSQPVTIDGSARYTVESTGGKHPYLIDVVRVNSTVAPAPEGYRMPVVYVTDGNSLFPLAAYLANSIVTFSRQIPSLLVVSIGYPADPQLNRQKNVENRLAWRNRDLTPKLAPGNKAPANIPVFGGAAEFLAFIDDDLKPFIAARYQVNPKDQTLVGHSSGGLFTLYALLNKPNSFQRYVAASPSLFWDDHALAKLAATLPGDHLKGEPTHVFVTVGGLETKQQVGEDMIGDATSFVAELEKRKLPNLELKFHVFPDENHITIIPSALMRGLSQVGALR